MKILEVFVIWLHFLLNLFGISNNEPNDSGESKLSKWINTGSKAPNDIWPSEKTIADLKEQADSTWKSFYKVQEDLLAKGSDVKSAFLEHPHTKAILGQVTTALDSLEGEGHKSFCHCINDPNAKALALQFQELNKQASEVFEYIIAHPNAVAAKEKYNALSTQTTEAYAALIEAYPAAEEVVNTVHHAIKEAEQLCKEHPVLCALLAAGLVETIFPSTFLGFLGFGKQGPIKNSWASRVQSAIYKGAVPEGSLFAELQRMGMVGLPLEARVVAVGGPVAALLLVARRRDWSGEGCRKLYLEAEKRSKLSHGWAPWQQI